MIDLGAQDTFPFSPAVGPEGAREAISPSSGASLPRISQHELSAPGRPGKAMAGGADTVGGAPRNINCRHLDRPCYAKSPHRRPCVSCAMIAVREAEAKDRWDTELSIKGLCDSLTGARNEAAINAAFKDAWERCAAENTALRKYHRRASWSAMILATILVGDLILHFAGLI